jgi:hypothetical protein
VAVDDVCGAGHWWRRAALAGDDPSYRNPLVDMWFGAIPDVHDAFLTPPGETVRHARRNRRDGQTA